MFSVLFLLVVAGVCVFRFVVSMLVVFWSRMCFVVVLCLMVLFVCDLCLCCVRAFWIIVLLRVVVLVSGLLALFVCVVICWVRVF